MLERLGIGTPDSMHSAIARQSAHLVVPQNCWALILREGTQVWVNSPWRAVGHGEAGGRAFQPLLAQSP